MRRASAAASWPRLRRNHGTADCGRMKTVIRAVSTATLYLVLGCTPSDPSIDLLIQGGYDPHAGQ